MLVFLSSLVVVSVATAAAATADYPDDKVTLPPATTSRTVRTQATQGSTRVCGVWARPWWAMVGVGGARSARPVMASAALGATTTAPRGVRAGGGRAGSADSSSGGEEEVGLKCLAHPGDPWGCAKRVKQSLQCCCAEEIQVRYM